MRAGKLLARRAKVAVLAAGAACFGAAMLLSRTSNPGHEKRAPTALAPPVSFVEAVRQSALQGGLLAPAQAPPEAATAVS